MSSALRAIRQDDFAAILALSAKQYGSRAYQATEAYLNWLYIQGPRAQGRGLVGFESDQLTTVIHEMGAWSGRQPLIIVAHNLFSYPNPKSGMGGKIIMRYTREPMIVPGAVPPLTHVYDLAKFIEVPLRSYMKKLPSVQSLYVLAKQRLTPSNLVINLRRAQALAGKFGITVENTFNPNAPYCDFLDKRDAMDMEFLKWRHFSEDGPKTLSFRDAAGNFALVSFGLRKKIPLARILEFNCSAKFLTDKVMPMISALGHLVVMSNSRYPGEWPILESAGFQRFNPELRAFVTRHVHPTAALSPAFSDLGLEAIDTRFE